MISWSRLALVGLVLHAGCGVPGKYLDFASYHGDARLWVRETDAYPRYVLLFPEISSDHSGEFVFQVSGLPEAELYFGMSVGSESDRDLIRAARVECECEVSLDGRGPVLQMKGRLETGEETSESGGWHCFDGYWIDGKQRPICYGIPPRGLRVSPNQRYVIRIRLSTPAGQDKPVGLTPLLSGGGIQHRFGW